MEGKYCVLLALAVACAFAQVVGFDFLNFDDPLYVTNNAMVREGLSWRSLRWAVTATEAANWHPLTWVSHMLDVQIWGVHPAGPHATNVVLHLANTLLLFVLLQATTGAVPRSAVVAALFGLHPSRVESVAWISERKDLLSTFFWLLTVGVYVRYTRRPTRLRYLWVGLGFAAALLSKPMVVTLPVVLLLMDWWPLERSERVGWGRLIAEKMPLVGLAVLAMMATMVAQQGGGAVVRFDDISLADRLANAVVSYWRYVGMLGWPSGLAPMYPYARWPPVVAVPAALGLVVVSAATFATRTWRPALAMGWAWFLVMLLPAIGLVQVGSQSIADRYTYLPAVGLFIAVVWTIASMPTVPAVALRVGGWLLPVLLGGLTWQQTQFWSDSVTLWTRALAVNEANGIAHNMLGDALAARGTQAEADAHYRRAFALNPRTPVWHNSEGILRAKRDDLDGAEASFRTAVALDPSYADALANLGDLLARQRRPAEAIAAYRAAAARRPDWKDLPLRIAKMLALAGDLPAAADEIRAALAREPADADAHAVLGQILELSGERDAALVEYDTALQRKPNWPEVRRAADGLRAR